MNTVPDDRIYSQQHLWLKMRSETAATVGVTDFAQSELGDIVFVELPELGGEYQIDQVCAVIESVKTASDVYMPVQGRVIDINKELLDSPEIINESPYENGWLCEIELLDKTAIDSLLDASQYEAHIGA